MLPRRTRVLLPSAIRSHCNAAEWAVFTPAGANTILLTVGRTGNDTHGGSERFAQIRTSPAGRRGASVETRPGIDDRIRRSFPSFFNLTLVMGVAPARGAFVNVNEGGTSAGFGSNRMSRIRVSSVRGLREEFSRDCGNMEM